MKHDADRRHRVEERERERDNRWSVLDAGKENEWIERHSSHAFCQEHRRHMFLKKDQTTDGNLSQSQRVNSFEQHVHLSSWKCKTSKIRLKRAKYLNKYLIKNYTHSLIIDSFSRASSHDFICPFSSSQVTPTRTWKQRTREPVNEVWCFSPFVSWNFILKPVKIHRDRSLALPSPWFTHHVSGAEKLRRERESQGRWRHNKRHAKVQLAGHKSYSSVLNTKERREGERIKRGLLFVHAIQPKWGRLTWNPVCLCQETRMWRRVSLLLLFTGLPSSFLVVVTQQFFSLPSLLVLHDCISSLPSVCCVIRCWSSWSLSTLISFFLLFLSPVVSCGGLFNSPSLFSSGVPPFPSLSLSFSSPSSYLLMLNQVLVILRLSFLQLLYFSSVFALHEKKKREGQSVCLREKYCFSNRPEKASGSSSRLKPQEKK